MAEAIPTNSPLDSIRAESDRIEEDALYSAKAQWETAREFEWVHYSLGAPATIAAAVAGVSAVSQYETLALLLSLLTAILTALLTFLDPKAKAHAHRAAGNAYKALSNDARIFREVTCGDTTGASSLQKDLNILNRRRNALNQKSPPPTRSGFERARKGIEEGEAHYRVDASKRHPNH
jgi:hypothetical protein